MPGGEQVIELSVEETNKLRAQLGLAPLRTSSVQTKDGGDGPQDTSGADASTQDETLEMSVDDSNALRAKLGLAPLRVGSSNDKKEEHKPAMNTGETKKMAERIEKARLQRAVQTGAAQYSKTSLGNDEQSALSFAEQMRQGKKAGKKSAKLSKVKTTSSLGETAKTAEYGESDVKGLTVGHAVGDFQEGSTTVLTLADTEILAADEASKRVTGLNQDEAQLENVNLAEQATIQQGLKEKRKMEMGMGRAGGYAGFDDDEFEELGGTQGPSRAARGAFVGNDVDGKKGSKRKSRGFQIGAMLEQQDEEVESDIFAAQSGKAISLQPTQADRTMSDFMTAEEEAELRPKKAKKKKEKEFKKKKHKKDKKDRKRKVESDDEEDPSPLLILSKKKSLADELEESGPAPVVGRKRRREGADNEDDNDNVPLKVSVALEKRRRFDAVMEKGNERTKVAFGKPKRELATDADEEPDDAFLNAALAKARRLNRLKQLSQPNVRGADAVAQALEQSSQIKTEPESVASNSGSGIKFSIDDTREFSLALRAKKEQEDRDRARKDAATAKATPVKEEDVSAESSSKTHPAELSTVNEEEEDVDMEELAKEVKEDEPDGVDMLNGESASVGRGLGGIMQMLRQTGELSRKNAGREEQRGRAKDERTYEDYEPLDLSRVVRIDERNATSKDRELASREIKLEYRDEHGRLLTRKEAFRDLSYQFHGFGSGKRKADKKMKQIAREQAEQRVASKQGTADGGMLGALKATQKATGKAFVVHKT